MDNFRSEVDASAILLVARRVAGTRMFPSTVSEFAISLPAPRIFQWKLPLGAYTGR